MLAYLGGTNLITKALKSKREEPEKDTTVGERHRKIQHCWL